MSGQGLARGEPSASKLSACCEAELVQCWTGKLICGQCRGPSDARAPSNAQEQQPAAATSSEERGGSVSHGVNHDGPFGPDGTRRQKARAEAVAGREVMASMQQMSEEAARRARRWLPGGSSLIYRGQPTAVLALLLEPNRMVYPSLSNLMSSGWAEELLGWGFIRTRWNWTSSIEKCLSMAGMLTIAHHVLHCTNGQIYGGFVRDSVLHGEKATDLDIGLRNQASLSPFLDQIINWTRSGGEHCQPIPGLSYVCTEWKGNHVVRATFQMSWGQHAGKFDVEVVNVPYWEQRRPLVDSDVNNLQVTLNGIEHMRAGQGGPIDKIIERALSKQFVPIDPDRPLRVKAMIEKGWQIANTDGSSAAAETIEPTNSKSSGRVIVKRWMTAVWRRGGVEVTEKAGMNTRLIGRVPAGKRVRLTGKRLDVIVTDWWDLPPEQQSVDRREIDKPITGWVTFTQLKPNVQAGQSLDAMIDTAIQTADKSTAKKERLVGVAKNVVSADGECRQCLTAKCLTHEQVSNLTREGRASLYISDLPPYLTETHPWHLEQILADSFGQAGQVRSVLVPRDNGTRMPLGDAYINFSTMSDAERALSSMNYSTMWGRPIQITWSDQSYPYPYPDKEPRGVASVAQDRRSPQKEPTAPVSANEAALRSWLAEKGLEELAPVFISKYYCDVDLMKEIGLDEGDLDVLEIHDVAQRAILLSQAQEETSTGEAAVSKAEGAVAKQEDSRDELTTDAEATETAANRQTGAMRGVTELRHAARGIDAASVGGLMQRLGLTVAELVQELRSAGAIGEDISRFQKTDKQAKQLLLWLEGVHSGGEVVNAALRWYEENRDRSPESMGVVGVMMPSGNRLRVPFVRSLLCVSDLSAAIATMSDINVESQIIRYAGKRCKPDQGLEDLGIRKGSVVQLVVKLR